MPAEKSLASALRPPSRALLGMVLLTAALSLLCGLAFLLDWDYLRLGYASIKTGAVDEVASGGAEIWGTGKLLLYFLLLAWAGVLVLWAYEAFINKPRTGRVTLTGAAVALGALLLAPHWVDFQVRYYLGPAQGVTLALGYRWAPWFSYAVTTESASHGAYPHETAYLCPSQHQWKIFRLSLRSHLYPILDKGNELNLLRTYCTPAPRDGRG